MKYISLFWLLIFMTSCNNNRVRNTVKTTDKIDLKVVESTNGSAVISSWLNISNVNTSSDVRIYNDVLNDLISNHFYYLYLGDSADAVYKGIYPGNVDTALISKRKKRFTKVLLDNKSKMCTIYLDKEQRSKGYDINFEGDERFVSKIKSILTKYSSDLDGVAKALSAREQGYEAKDFDCEIATIQPIYDIKNVYSLMSGFVKKQNKCVIGVVSMSKIVLDDSNSKGVLFYNFLCGNKCAKGELIEIVKANGKWKIVNAVQFWVS